MAKQEPKTEVATQTQGGAVVPIDADLAAMLAGDAGMGKQEISSADMAIPRLAVLQSGSPQVIKGKAEYVDGAVAGMIYDSVLNRSYSGETGIIVIPVSYRRAYLEWITRKAGGGFVADHGNDESVLAKCKVDAETKANITPEGHEIVLTAEYFSFIVNPDSSVNPVILSMAKTQHRKARVWNTLINQLEIPNPAGGEGTINPAMFYRSYHLTTVPESNDKGNWFGWKIEGAKMTLELPRGREIYMRARKFFADIQAGAVKVAAPVEGGTTEDENAPM